MSEIRLLEIFGDESGSISKKRDFPFFVICLIVPKDVSQLKNDFKRWRLRTIKTYKLNKNEEMKGSKLSDSDIIDFAQIFIEKLSPFAAILDCSKAKDRMVENPRITYNFIVNKLFERILSKVPIDANTVVHFQLDNFNNGVGSLKSLEDYLAASQFNNDKLLAINVNYFDSSANWKIQLADIFAHFVYRSIQKRWKLPVEFEVRNIY